MGLVRSRASKKFLEKINTYKPDQQELFEDTVRKFTALCNELSRSDRLDLCHRMIDDLLKREQEIKAQHEQTGSYRFNPLDYTRAYVKDALLAKSVAKLKPTPDECWALLRSMSRLETAFMGMNAPKALLRYVANNWDDCSQSKRLSSSIPPLIAELSKSRDKSLRNLAVYMAERIEGESHLPLDRGEAWSDAALDRIDDLDPQHRRAFLELLKHASSASSSRPSKKWLITGTEHIAALDGHAIKSLILEWFPLVNRPRTSPSPGRDWREHAVGDQLILDHHADILKGLCWMISTEEDADIARALGDLALSCYRKVPGVGPRAVKVGNAAVYALGAMPGRAAIGPLAVLRVKLKFASAQKLIVKALDAVAEREEIPRDEIEEMAVPAYGLDEVGFGEEQLGECTARITVSSAGNTSPCKLDWINPKGKTIKTVPAVVKDGHPDELKELKAAVKDINKMLPVQRDRIDALFLERGVWPLDRWRERYLDHPLVGTIARRMIWVFSHEGTETAAAWLAGDPSESAHGPGSLVRADGTAFDPHPDATVSLWHPVRENVVPGDNAVRDDVQHWRLFYESRGIVQPFKQAHREVYLLTDAERRTEVYSNRFAAHILRQHQFNALATSRSWKNQLRIMADMECHAPRRDLRQWGLRAEFWIEGVGDDYNDEYVLESGAFRYIATDQVRFYAIEAAQNMGHAWSGPYTSSGSEDDPLDHPIDLDRIPPIVLSEILRDVDLFVGVASVGNNPEWEDGGPDGRFRDYWHTYSFGDLSGTAKTRRELLERFVPRLKIAPQCEVGDKFLIVRGNVRTYKIHLGSGNILMEPDDQYLCIVPTSAMSKPPGGGSVRLPFEGDRTLAIILSKAFMLADDHTIKDKTILSQINR